MCRKWRAKERRRGGGELVYLTSVNICIRKLPHMLRHRLCQHILRTTVRMRNFSYASPGLCFSVSASVMQYYDFYTFTHLSSLPPTTLTFVQFGFPFLFLSFLCFSFLYFLPWTALLITSQSIGGSFMFAHFNIFRLLKCSFFTMP